MIWVRRLLAIPLILLFVIIFIVVLTITQVNGTFANPDFYTDQLRKADMYNFLYDEALPAALDEVETGDTSDFNIDIQVIKDDIVAAARKILPPEWLEAQVETAADTIAPYILGDKDSFTYTVQFRDRVEAAAAVIKSDIIQGAAFDSLYDDGISYAADRVGENLGTVAFPYSLTVTGQDIEEALKKNYSPGLGSLASQRGTGFPHGLHNRGYRPLHCRNQSERARCCCQASPCRHGQPQNPDSIQQHAYMQPE